MPLLLHSIQEYHLLAYSDQRFICIPKWTITPKRERGKERGEGKRKQQLMTVAVRGVPPTAWAPQLKGHFPWSCWTRYSGKLSFPLPLRTTLDLLVSEFRLFNKTRIFTQGFKTYFRSNLVFPWEGWESIQKNYFHNTCDQWKVSY